MPAAVGELRERIRIDLRGTAIDEMGGQNVIWTPFSTTWAKIIPLALRAEEQMEGGGLSAVETYLFIIRRRTDLDAATMRVIWPVDPMAGNNVAASQKFNLRSVNLPPTRELYMMLKAELGVAM